MVSLIPEMGELRLPNHSVSITFISLSFEGTSQEKNINGSILHLSYVILGTSLSSWCHTLLVRTQ